MGDLIIWGISTGLAGAGAALNGAGEAIGDGIGAAGRAIENSGIFRADSEEEPEVGDTRTNEEGEEEVYTGEKGGWSVPQNLGRSGPSKEYEDWHSSGEKIRLENDGRGGKSKRKPDADGHWPQSGS